MYKLCMQDDIDNSCCFEILGFDILLDKELHPWLLEVNHSPSFSTDTPLDWSIKMGLIADTMTLLHMTAKKKRIYLQKKIKELKKRVLKKDEQNVIISKEKYRAKKYKLRVKYEESHLGRYNLVYPQDETKDNYQICLERAKELYITFMNERKKAEYLEKIVKDPKKTFKSPTKIRKSSIMDKSILQFLL